MRIINRVVLTKETKDSVVTRVTERIVEDDQYRMIAVVPGAAESGPSKIEVRCNICTELFIYGDSDGTCCPACGSRDVNLV